METQKNNNKQMAFRTNYNSNYSLRLLIGGILGIPSTALHLPAQLIHPAQMWIMRRALLAVLPPFLKESI